MFSIIIFVRNLKRVYRLSCKPWLKLTVAPVAVVFIDFLKVVYFFPGWLKDGGTSRRRRSLSRCQAQSPASLRDLMHWNSLRSLLRTYERSTCSKSSVFISCYPTSRKKRGTRVVGVQQTNSGGEGRRRKGKVVSFPGPSLPPTSMCLLLLPHALVQFLRSPCSLAFWLSVHLM